MRGGIENQNVLSLLECHSYSIYYCDRAKVLDVLSYYVIFFMSEIMILGGVLMRSVGFFFVFCFV